MDIWIIFPREEPEARIIEVFAGLGFPGCVGSTDCTHVAMSGEVFEPLLWKIRFFYRSIRSDRRS